MTPVIAPNWVDCEEFSIRPYEIYFKALTEKEMTVEEFGGETYKPYPDTSTTIRLPRCVRGISKREFYRTALAHRALHHQLGTFDFKISRIEDDVIRRSIKPPGEGSSDFEGFFATFADTELAHLVFEAIEDMRVDRHLPHVFKGLHHSLSLAVKSELLGRPTLSGMAPREGALEFITRRSLSDDLIDVPIELVDAASQIDTVLESINFLEAKVEDMVVATIRLYGIVSGLPNLGAMASPTLSSPYSSKGTRTVELIWPRTWPEAKRSRIEGDGILILTVPKVVYRGSLETFFISAPHASGPDHQSMYRMRSALQDADNSAGSFQLPKVTGPPEPLPHDHHDVSRHLHRHEEGELTTRGPNTFLYREWDRYIGRYRPNWVRVIQLRPRGGGSAARNSLQLRYANELRRLRKAMDLPKAQGFNMERRSTSGSDIDYDAAVEAIIDHRVSGEFSDAVYQDMKRQRRDIAVLVLVDVSASTAERVEDAEPVLLDLCEGLENSKKLRAPRILDIEVVSALLCASVLNGVGDLFSIWSFSGTGREGVVMSEVKGFHESFSGVVVSRAAGLKPHHATRLGAALRHCGGVLSKVQAETKVLLVVTDGRPYDIDYGTSYGEDEAQSYALADSDMALSELSQMGIEPYLLTVDAQGEEYVSAFENVHVEVLRDVKALPEKLISLYMDLVVGRTRSKYSAVRMHRTNDIF